MYRGERFNSLSHLVATLFVLPGAIVLIVLSALAGDPRKIVGAAVYGATLVFLYASSTLYHSVRGRPKRILQRFDHQAIYLLIAGSYTPFCLVTLRGPWGWSLLGVVWGLALVGGILEFLQKSEARILSVIVYVTMGWAAVVALAPLLRALGRAGFAWVVAGGLLYTVGIVFYALDTRMRHAHGVWHLFVIAGSAAHYVAVLEYVVRAPAAPGA